MLYKFGYLENFISLKKFLMADYVNVELPIYIYIYIYSKNSSRKLRRVLNLGWELKYTHTQIRKQTCDVDVKCLDDTGRWCQRLTRLVVSRQKFPAVGALVKQLGLPVDKVRSNQDVEFFGKA